MFHFIISLAFFLPLQTIMPRPPGAPPPPPEPVVATGKPDFSLILIFEFSFPFSFFLFFYFFLFFSPFSFSRSLPFSQFRYFPQTQKFTYNSRFPSAYNRTPFTFRIQYSLASRQFSLLGTSSSPYLNHFAK